MTKVKTPYQFLPWDDVMKFGLGYLRLDPNTLWAMTPREFNAALEGVFGPPSSLPPPARREFLQLMQRYPDES